MTGLIGLLGAVFAASLLGSLHCAGMCGALVAVCATQGARARGQGAYHLGRLAGYTLVGALAGGLGAGLDAAAALGGVQRGAAVVAGAALVGAGLASLASARRGGVGGGPWASALASLRSGPRLPAPLAAGARRALAAAAAVWPTWRALAVGLATPLLPCGWLYLFALTAAGTGSAAGGAAVMVAFWAGTVPVLLGLGLGLGRALAPVRGRAVAGVALVLAGGLTLVQRAPAWPAAADEPARAAPAAADAPAEGPHVPEGVPPCCGGHVPL